MTIGKKNSTLVKQQVKESKLLTTGIKTMKFWHEATAGETSIPFGSLVLPADIAANGLSNPTSTEILSANLALFHTNVEVHSSLNQKLMEGLTYVVKNNQIKFINGYVAALGEIFAVVFKNDVITGTNVVDARPLTATGVLTAGQTDFNVGEAFKTNAYPSEQLGEVLVFIDGVAQFRNVGNATASPTADGNYQEVHSLGGFGTIIRFNDVFATDKNIQVISRNLIAERPDISMMQLIESLGGQIDSVLQTVADLANVPVTNFQSNPNQVDLRNFGDRVVNLEKILDLNVAKTEAVECDVVSALNGFIPATGIANKIEFNPQNIFSQTTSGEYHITANDDCIVNAQLYAYHNGSSGSSISVEVHKSTDGGVTWKRVSLDGNDNGLTASGVGRSASTSFCGSLKTGDKMRFYKATGSTIIESRLSVNATALTKIKDLI